MSERTSTNEEKRTVFSDKGRLATHLEAWASEGFFQGAATMGFFQNFSGGDQK